MLIYSRVAFCYCTKEDSLQKQQEDKELNLEPRKSIIDNIEILTKLMTQPETKPQTC